MRRKVNEERCILDVFDQRKRIAYCLWCKYIGKTKKGKVDFVVRKDGKIFYVQVAIYLSNEEVIKREFSAFDPIEDNHPKYVITQDKDDFSKDGIIHINIIKFLMNDRL